MPNTNLMIKNTQEREGNCPQILVYYKLQPLLYVMIWNDNIYKMKLEQCI